MKPGYLSEYFVGVAAKRLSAVEVDQTRSNQHEFHATKQMKEFLGSPEDKMKLTARFLYLDDYDSDPIVDDAYLTLYNCRKGKARAPEFHLYFPATNVSNNAHEGDLLVIAKMREGGLLVIIAEDGSTIGRQVEWLFGFLDLAHPGFSIKSELETEQIRIDFASRFILENIGIHIDESEHNYLEEMLTRFDGCAPNDREMSAYARSTIEDLSAHEQPDLVLMTWMEREEILYRTLEKYLIAEQMSRGLKIKENTSSIDNFFSFYPTVQMNRMNRVRHALGNHLERLFLESNLLFTRLDDKEIKLKADFIFPGVDQYNDLLFDPKLLTMLAVEPKCKDNWEEVLGASPRIREKHIITLETSIPSKYTDLMAAKGIQLILPRSLHQTYSKLQQDRLLDLEDFIRLTKERQGNVRSP